MIKLRSTEYFQRMSECLFPGHTNLQSSPVQKVILLQSVVRVSCYCCPHLGTVHFQPLSLIIHAQRKSATKENTNMLQNKVNIKGKIYCSRAF